KGAKFADKATVCKYIVPDGYPGNAVPDQVIDVDEKRINDAGVQVYYAAVNEKDGKVYSSSSRALSLVSVGETIEEAEKICEDATKYVKGDIYHRRDVGTSDLIQKRIDHMKELKK
ncbi:MAG: phosphoribosylglycinamide synthetase C domain-containing protein, partial [Methanobacterium sp.]